MPQLDANTAEQVAATESGGFEPLAPDTYVARLREVTVGNGAKGPYWKWEYEIPAGYPHAGRRFWNTTSLSENSRFKFKETFDAFGVASNTHTDLLCGKEVRLELGVRVIQQGNRAGENANYIIKVASLEDGGVSSNGSDPLANENDEEPF